MKESTKKYYSEILSNIEKEGLYKKERIITTPQGAEIKVSTGETVLNFCANNYLGLSSHPDVIQAAKDTMDSQMIQLLITAIMILIKFHIDSHAIWKESRKTTFRSLPSPHLTFNELIVACCKEIGNNKQD